MDVTRFPTAAHLASWAGLGPGNHESAGKRKTGKRKTGKTRDGNPHLTTVLVEAAWATARTRTRPGARFRRLHRRMGKTAAAKAAVAVAHTLLVIIWQLLTHGGTYTDLGADYYTRRDNPDTRAARLTRQLEAPGYTVALNPTP